MLGYSGGVLPREGGSREVQRVHPNVILAVLSLSALVYAALSSAVIPALPALQDDLHATETGVTWLLTGFLLSASVGTAIIGKLGDMYGKQRLLVWTLLALAAGTLLAALSGSQAGSSRCRSQSPGTSSRGNAWRGASASCRRSSGSAAASGSLPAA
jgi:MFS family permease